MSDARLWLDDLQGSGIRPGLGRIRALLRTLGRPERAFPSIIVAGTNGKGSTSATLASILNASGYRTGLYTSPHLVDLRERWQIGGELIADEALDGAIETLRRGAEHIGITPTYFEALTIIAFIAFAEAKCEVAVLEVGMGGRLDATNVVRPLAALITPIGMDHQEFLGTTIRKIAAEKAGVIHRGAFVLTSNTDPEIVAVLRKRAEKFGNEFDVVMPDGGGKYESPLLGDFQRMNVALAVRAARKLGFPKITEESIARGVASTRWRGRLEKLAASGKEIWIDGGHNAHAARAIAPFLDATLARPRLLVFGIMSDKDVGDVAATLFPLFDAIITTEPYPPRSTPAESLAEIAHGFGVPAIAEPAPEAALLRALQSPERCVFVGGSLYLAGAAIAFFDPHDGEQRER